MLGLMYDVWSVAYSLKVMSTSAYQFLSLCPRECSAQYHPVNTIIIVFIITIITAKFLRAIINFIISTSTTTITNYKKKMKPTSGAA